MEHVSLQELFAQVPDPRCLRGRRYPLGAILNLVTVGLLMGRQSLTAIAQLTDDYGPNLALALGFPTYKTPTCANLSILLRKIDIKAFEDVLARWLANRLTDDQRKHLAIDGKTLRGSRRGAVPGVHLVAAYAPSAQAVLAQLKVDSTTNEHKAALELLGLLPKNLQGTVFTGDAMFCQQEMCQEITQRGGDYLFVVKNNQVRLKNDVSNGLSFEQTASTFSPRGTLSSASPVAPS